MLAKEIHKLITPVVLLSIAWTLYGKYMVIQIAPYTFSSIINLENCNKVKLQFKKNLFITHLQNQTGTSTMYQDFM